MSKLEIAEQKENPLFPRKEVLAVASGFSSTPSRAEVVKALAEKLGSDEEKIVLRRIEHEFGAREARVFAFVYPDAATLKKFEKRFVSLRGRPKEKKEEIK